VDRARRAACIFISDSTMSATLMPCARNPMSRKHLLQRLPARPLILGHRGAPLEAPENTLRAFELALERGADGVELDVQRSADGVPVVIHDETLERTTDGSGPVSACTAAELRRFSSRGEPIPTLEEAIAWAAARGAWLNIELKAQAAEQATLDLVRAAGWQHRTILSSFQPTIVEAALRLAPDVLCFLLAERWDDEYRAGYPRLAPDGVCLHVDAATPGTLQELGANEIPVIVWTVDDADRMRQLIDAGACAVITERPEPVDCG
jgi:glycerophosphoryl diester phosphodiesterase